MMDPINLIDEFLTQYKKRGAFTRAETVDILLDVRSAIVKGHNARIQEEPSSPDRADSDSSRPAHGQTVAVSVVS